MRTVTHIFTLIIIVFLLLSCAQQVSPTGGAKDTTPPKIIMSNPGNFSLNFSGDAIELKFDEFVQFKNIEQQMVISPAIKTKPKPKLKGKKVIIYLGDSLKPNTTYQVNFGGSIVDWNEGNALDSNLFVFSTGDYIDSLQVLGEVKDAYTHQPAGDVLVMLYETDYDSIPYKEIPIYFTKTDKSGFFELNYLKAGEYKVVALKDLNNNYLFDNPEELIGFAENINIPQDSGKVKMQVFQEKQKRKQFIISAKMIEYGRLRILLNEPLMDFKVNVLNHQFKKAWFIEEQFTNKDTIDYWFTDFEGLDSLTIELSDSTVLDTVYLDLSQQKKAEKLIVNMNTTPDGSLAPFNDLKLIFSEPLLDYSLDSVSLISTIDSSEIVVKIKDVSKSQRQITLDFDKKEGMNYLLQVPPNQFTSIFKNANDTLKKLIKILPYHKFANLQLEVVLDSLKETSSYYLVQILNEKKQIIREESLTKTAVIKINNMPPGKYQALLIFDQNNNRKWDTGNYLQKIQAEKIIVYQEAIEIKGGWDLDLRWIIKN